MGDSCEQHYRLGETLGSGSFAIVKKAVCRSDGEELASLGTFLFFWCTSLSGGLVMIIILTTLSIASHSAPHGTCRVSVGSEVRRPV